MLKHNSIQVGEKISMTDYFTVKSIHEGGIVATNSAGVDITINGTEMIESKFNSNSQYTETVKAGKNALAEILQTAGDKIFTVCFEKKDGSERVLTGHFISSEPNLGRTKVIDLEIPIGQHNFRQIDNRTIKWIVTDQTKYVAQ